MAVGTHLTEYVKINSRFDGTKLFGKEFDKDNFVFDWLQLYVYIILSN